MTALLPPGSLGTSSKRSSSLRRQPRRPAPTSGCGGLVGGRLGRRAGQLAQPLLAHAGGVRSGVRYHAGLVGAAVVVALQRERRVERVGAVGREEQPKDAREDLQHRRVRRPVAVEDRVAHLAVRVDVAVDNRRDEAHLGRLHRVLVGEAHVQQPVAADVRAAVGAAHQHAPEGEVVLAREDVDGAVRRAAEFAHLAQHCAARLARDHRRLHAVERRLQPEHRRRERGDLLARRHGVIVAHVEREVGQLRVAHQLRRLELAQLERVAQPLGLEAVAARRLGDGAQRVGRLVADAHGVERDAAPLQQRAHRVGGHGAQRVPAVAQREHAQLGARVLGRKGAELLGGGLQRVEEPCVAVRLDRLNAVLELLKEGRERARHVHLRAKGDQADLRRVVVRW
eukprot:scaffold128693_cov68-Phaeocystis_antarctica.AAC.20